MWVHFIAIGGSVMHQLAICLNNKGYKIYLLGAKEEVVSKLVRSYITKFGEELIAGYRNGYFSDENEDDIIKDIIDTGTQILFVGISSPKKEQFLHRNKAKLSAVNFIMGVGGSFDVLSGNVKRAPKWVQKIGMEWSFRLIQEPKRMWKRYLIGNSKFIALVLKEKLKFK